MVAPPIGFKTEKKNESLVHLATEERMLDEIILQNVVLNMERYVETQGLRHGKCGYASMFRGYQITPDKFVMYDERNRILWFGEGHRPSGDVNYGRCKLPDFWKVIKK